MASGFSAWYTPLYPAARPLIEEVYPDASALAAVWAQVIGTAGAYQGMGDAVAHQAGDYTVVDVPLHFEAADLTGRVSYARTGQVAGLFFLNPQ